MTVAITVSHISGETDRTYGAGAAQSLPKRGGIKLDLEGYKRFFEKLTSKS